MMIGICKYVLSGIRSLYIISKKMIMIEWLKNQLDIKLYIIQGMCAAASFCLYEFPVLLLSP